MGVQWFKFKQFTYLPHLAWILAHHHYSIKYRNDIVYQKDSHKPQLCPWHFESSV